ncbi:MAG: L,D-transpeptidase [Ilumatobacteraceae bacterium]
MIKRHVKAIAIAAMTVAAVIGGVTVLAVSDDSKITPAAADSSVGSTVPTATAPASTLPTTTVAPTTTSTTIPEPEPELGKGCTDAGVSAAIDRDMQLAWLCLDGYITIEFPITTAWSMPDPGVYEVFAKVKETFSNIGGHYSTLRNFVAFSYGENTGARVAFHAVPILRNGSLVQPIDSVGDLDLRGESAGCIRVAPITAQVIWNTMSIGDTVTVLT